MQDRMIKDYLMEEDPRNFIVLAPQFVPRISKHLAGAMLEKLEKLGASSGRFALLAADKQVYLKCPMKDEFGQEHTFWPDLLAPVLVDWISVVYNFSRRFDVRFLECSSLVADHYSILWANKPLFPTLEMHREAGTSPSSRRLAYLYMVTIAENVAAAICRDCCDPAGDEDVRNSQLSQVRELVFDELLSAVFGAWEAVKAFLEETRDEN